MVGLDDLKGLFNLSGSMILRNVEPKACCEASLGSSSETVAGEVQIPDLRRYLEEGEL